MKSVLITGTSKGIGLATALAFARKGYLVFATMRNPESAGELKKHIEEESLPIRIYTMDVDSDGSVSNAISDILKEHGSIDVLVNNAGVEKHGSVEETSMEDFKAVMETNYFGALRCIKALLPLMRKNRNGCIINVTSVAGKIANTPLGPYSASKFALESISESLAQEVKPFNIRVAIVEPGIIDTSMARNIEDAEYSIYPQVNRFGGLFEASLRNPTSPSLVADKMVDIAESGTWTLRHPVGPDAEPFLQWRASMDDETWTNWNAATDEEWYSAVLNTFGMDVKREKQVG